MLVDSLHLGGGESFLVGLATNLPRDRWEVTVCATRRHEGPLTAELVDAGVRYEALGRTSRYDLLPFARLVSLLRRERFDVLHAHMFGSNLWGTIFGRLTRTPVVVAHEQTWSYEGQPLRRFLDGYVIGRGADAMVAVSTRDQERMIELEGVPARKTTYIPNAFIPRPGNPPEGDLRAELGIDPGAPVVGTLAVLRPQKAIDVLIDAFAIVADRIPDAQLVIGGYGPMADTWHEHASRSGLGDRVHWLGMRRDQPVVLGGMDVAAMSSDFEGTPLFAFECMAARTPLVATDVGGLRDIFTSGESALLVPPRDPAAMADAIASLLQDPKRRGAMADAARARLAEFTVECAVERVEELYEELLTRHGRSGRPVSWRRVPRDADGATAR
jgi:glycosyltransferase involved in cell wall biosynthesis